MAVAGNVAAFAAAMAEQLSPRPRSSSRGVATRAGVRPPSLSPGEARLQSIHAVRVCLHMVSYTTVLDRSRSPKMHCIRVLVIMHDCVCSPSVTHGSKIIFTDPIQLGMKEIKVLDAEFEQKAYSPYLQSVIDHMAGWSLLTSFHPCQFLTA